MPNHIRGIVVVDVGANLVFALNLYSPWNNGQSNDGRSQTGRKIFRPYPRDFDMPYDPDIRRRRSIRLQGHDYSQAGAYFITICTQNRECLFGKIVDGEMRLNDAGRIVQKCWNEIPSHFPHVELDEFVAMPNHVHGIVIIVNNPTVGAKNFSPLPKTSRRPSGTSKNIGSIVRGFKIGVTKWMRTHTMINDVWQRNYWEHIIHNEMELNRIREYIHNNPTQWKFDRLNFYEGGSACPNMVREPVAIYATERWMV